MASEKATPSEYPVILYETPADWATWLDENHLESKGVWMRLAKKASGITSIDYAQALDEALCYGWIDGQKKTYDETSWLQKFTPRGKKSMWSQINVEKVKGLIESGRMKPAGLRAIEAAQQDGRWDAAYAPASTIEMPEDFQAALDANEAAKSFYATLNKANRYAILFRVHQAKRPETRAKRIQEFVSMLERNEKLHS